MKSPHCASGRRGSPNADKAKDAILRKMMVEIVHYLKMMMIMILALLASCVVPYLPPPGT
jgi:hypothetical protein